MVLQGVLWRKGSGKGSADAGDRGTVGEAAMEGETARVLGRAPVELLGVGDEDGRGRSVRNRPGRADIPMCVQMRPQRSDFFEVASAEWQCLESPIDKCEELGIRVGFARSLRLPFKPAALRVATTARLHRSTRPAPIHGRAVTVRPR